MRYRDEMALIARMLLEYGDLEFALMHCVSQARNGDLDSVLKPMFKERSEWKRINEAERLGTPNLARLRLGTVFKRAIKSMHYCRKLRNQYAHSYWHDYADRLCFVALEELAKTPTTVSNLLDLKFYFLNKGLLEKQLSYFRFTQYQLTYINFQAQQRLGNIRSAPEGRSRTMKQPPKYALAMIPR